jgi:protochlorophyllide reductase
LQRNASGQTRAARPAPDRSTTTKPRSAEATTSASNEVGMGEGPWQVPGVVEGGEHGIGRRCGRPVVARQRPRPLDELRTPGGVAHAATVGAGRHYQCGTWKDEPMADDWNEAAVPDLTGRTALVTGANAGLGFEITRMLAGHGARVLMAGRNEETAATAAAALRAAAPPGSVEVIALDLADMGSIDAAATTVAAGGDRLDLLVNNAGLMAVDRSFTTEGFEMQLGVNHLGHFALTLALMPLLTSTPGSRVVTMSSMGHRAGHMDFGDLMFERRRYERWTAYFQSKLANLLFTAELQRRLGPASPTAALAAHPGASHTDLGTEGSSIANRVVALAVPFTTQPAATGALPAVRAAVDPGARGGEYYGPRFMVRGRPVRETPSHRARRADDAVRLWEISEELTHRTLPAAVRP